MRRWGTVAYVAATLAILALVVVGVFIHLPPPTAELYFFSALLYEMSLWPAIIAVVATAVVLALPARRGRLPAATLGVVAVALFGAPLAFALPAASAADTDISIPEVFTARLVDNGMRGDETVEVATVEGTTLEAAVWHPRAQPTGAVVVMVHGGGFTDGNRNQLARLNDAFTRAGHAVVDIDYRKAPEVTIAEQVGDVTCGIARAREIAGAERVYVFGSSAGGTLGLLSAYAGDEVFPSSCGRAVPIDRVAVIGAATDLTTLIDTDAPSWFPGWVTDPTGLEIAAGAPIGDADTYLRLSPATYVSPNSPETLLIHTGADRLAPAEQSRTLAERLDAAGVGNEIVSVGRSAHAFEFVWSGYGNQIARERLDRFFP